MGEVDERHGGGRVAAMAWVVRCARALGFLLSSSIGQLGRIDVDSGLRVVVSVSAPLGQFLLR